MNVWCNEISFVTLRWISVNLLRRKNNKLKVNIEG